MSKTTDFIVNNPGKNFNGSRSICQAEKDLVQVIKHGVKMKEARDAFYAAKNSVDKQDKLRDWNTLQTQFYNAIDKLNKIY